MSYSIEPTTTTPDAFAGTAEVCFIITTRMKLITGKAEDHIGLVLEKVHRDFDGGEEACEWLDRHRLNAGYVLSSGVIILWGKPDDPEVELLVEAFGVTTFRYWSP